MTRAGLELAGAQGRKETRNNQGKIQARPRVGSGHRGLPAELRLGERRPPWGMEFLFSSLQRHGLGRVGVGWELRPLRRP